ncbi:S41 family peptidase [Luteimicrobium sp. DT211]|uniref:S41 family peptidase n=1 Tax=Luteimicrobium sp. DT211 TaxID=3393412 RepID=UPI003CF2BFB2
MTTDDHARGTLLADVAPRLAAASRLDGGERLQVIDALVTVLDGVYAHLPAKCAAYATDPVQALALLRRRAGELSDAELHLTLTRIVAGLRDRHTRYVGPTPLHGRVAALPFLVEAYGPRPTFVVSKTDAAGGTGGMPDGFAPGAEVVSWNAVPIARAVERHADAETGGRPDARRARALESLTFRALDYGPPPDEWWVDVGYRPVGTRGGLGAVREARFAWRVLAPGRAATAVRDARLARKLAIDPAGEAVRRAKKMQFSSDLWHADRTAAAPMQDVVTARALDDRTGYLRLWSFDVQDDEAYLDEVAALLRGLPPERLVVDLRGNPGGLVWAAERLLQLFTDGPVLPARFSLLATPLTRQMADSPFNRLELEAWSPSLQDAVTTGDVYSQPLPVTDPAWCRDRDRAFPGRAVAVVDATTYSSGDLFAAGWVDNGVGPLVAVGAGPGAHATGGGGATVWTYAQLRDALDGTDQPLPALPEGCGLTVAVRRAVRSAAADGVPLEDLGVGGRPYTMTKRDVLEGNVDLLRFCAQVLGDA